MKARRATAIVLAGLIVSMPAAPALADAGPREPDWQALLDKVVDSGAVAAIAEVRDGGKTWRGASGKTRMGGGEAATADGRFRIGSVTKSFTAAVVLQLVGEGELSLSDSVGSGVTVRHLLQHTSGIPEYSTKMFDKWGIPKERFRTWSARELVAKTKGLPREFRPGTEFGYSNTNYLQPP
ncbi:D-alanyl-D-alanine carboxypeptidase [Nonomuraea solani]|uniref:D-alanyl-D-alanine carboxypeptidase n=1 Tax=Nonomuraea solani TaxID=1144553 RepID=A0A1H6DTF3_9ACTN|nr:serine hydrolase domain-containing protein [Nonomuraea solani]SEG88509.1 D-alanyl-D-alanine carboxypeptidase [Nonomuraea solani]